MTQPDTKPKHLKEISYKADREKAWEESLNAVDDARRNGLV